MASVRCLLVGSVVGLYKRSEEGQRTTNTKLCTRSPQTGTDKISQDSFRKCFSNIFETMLLLNILVKSLFIATLATASTITELNNDNWELLTKGKTVWVKFCTTSCDHCRQMHIAWERLGDAFEDVEVSLCSL
jgi:hypothetical protein